MKKIVTFIVILSSYNVSVAQEVIENDTIIISNDTIQLSSDSTLLHNDTTLSMLFMGDVMGHGTQINAAFDDNTGRYNYDSCFKYISPVISQADIAIANLEVTLAGWPYKGYPQFSSPDVLAVALKNAGVDILATANNHALDRRKKGLERTIDMLDSLKISHTGTFKNAEERKKAYPMMIEKNGFKIALLNYTYATNGIPVSKPNIVNMINKETIAKDLKAAKAKKPDHIIIFMHWGAEYQLKPNKYETTFNQFCKDNGADIVIGSHPHVIQKMELTHADTYSSLTAYSLGNFISNQRTSPRDGGAMIQINFKKIKDKSIIDHAGYYLTWVYKPLINGARKFRVLPLAQYEDNKALLSEAALKKMTLYKKIARKLFDAENINVPEYIYDAEKEGWKMEE